MNRYKMFFIMIANSLLRRKARMAIALLAVAIGATIISGMITVYKEVPEQMGRAFRAYGANMLILPGGDQPVIHEDTIANVRKTLSDYEIVGITPFLYDTLLVNHQTVMAGGTDFAVLQEVSPYWQIRGDWPTPGEKDILLGAEFAQKLRVSPGDTVTVSGGEGTIVSDYRVSGIVRTGGNEENFVFVPLGELQSIKNRPDEISLAQVSVVAGQEDLARAEAKIRADVPGAEPQLVKQIAQSQDTVLGKLQALVLIVTIVVLVLTLICVSTTMMAIVTERRKEIGLKKALGADNRHIVAEFFGEGCLLGALGGVLGSGFGYLFAESVSVNVFGRGIEFSATIVVVALIMSIFVTGVASLLPVRIATNVDPAIILRGE
ncbi:ABC transporter permease [Selenomonas artemidis]|jgi:ABC superfamily ATP binding cassette transporter, membrane protein|uniref:ABC transporter permease n=1 Tax=Selenomonas artemidis TaxID=671224 RepID=UPI000428F539|nr:FtsX-like permease family protein [Selenomonas artemidis]